VQKLEFYAKERFINSQEFVRLGLFNSDEVHSLVTSRRNLQKWVIYYSKNGGLNLLPNHSFDINDTSGLIPSPFTTDAALGWITDENGLQSVMVTAKMKGSETWDWGFQAGHESTHLTSAPIPLYTEVYHYQNYDYNRFINLDSKNDLTINDIAKLTNAYCEIVVGALDKRPLRLDVKLTDTGVYVVETQEEMKAFLNLSYQLMPNFGFDRALSIMKECNYYVSFEDYALFQLAAPCLRALNLIKDYVNTFTPPSVQWFEDKLPKVKIEIDETIVIEKQLA
jgi:hypothetical protein